jgi:uncharacterized protein
MKSKNIFFIILIAVALATFFYSMQNTGTDEAYKSKLQKERKDKDDFMRNNSQSPFADSTQSFKGLNYFEVDERFRIAANLTPITNRKSVVLATSDGLEKRYLEYAYVEFSLDNEKCRLLILEIMDMGPFRGTLFLAFADGTSTGETYGAGRYLDIKKVPGSTSITLDFNKAYNPYCAYNDGFSCPFPSTENLLKVSVKAGEKNYH